MCTSIWFKDESKHVSNVRGLADHLGVDPLTLIWNDDYEAGPGKDDFSYCLCPINIPETLKRHGYAGDWDANGDPMNFIATKAA